jgi:hypothetical protein
MPRTGSEPATARSALRLRLGLSVFGEVVVLAGLAGFALTGHTGWAVTFGILWLLVTVDLVVVVRHIRQGPHYQPGRDVPPYPPVDRP